MSGTAYIGLGSNLGNRRRHLARALEQLDRRTLGLAAVSRLYESAPLYVLDQPAFLNAAARVSVGVEPAELLALIAALESDAGRVRDERFGPRTLDLDILLWGEDGGTVIRTPTLTIPHPRLLERAFALRPLAEVASAIVHPLCGRRVDELAEALSGGDVQVVGEAGWAAEVP